MPEHLILLVIIPQKWTRDLQRSWVCSALTDWLPQRRQLQINVAEEFFLISFGANILQLDFQRTPY